MPQPTSNPTRRPRRARPAIVLAALVLAAVVAGVLGAPALHALSSPALSSPALVPSAAQSSGGRASPAPGGSTLGPEVPTRPARPPGSARRSVFDDEDPTVTRLDPALLRAVRAAATDAARDDVEFVVNSGWRSKSEQERLFRAAVAEYGSPAEAARWVARPGTSAHEAGDAVDLGPTAAATWLAGHGAGYGLCQIYRNEPWHFELRRDAVDHGCPPAYADPTHDPRMRP